MRIHGGLIVVLLVETELARVFFGLMPDVETAARFSAGMLFHLPHELDGLLFGAGLHDEGYDQNKQWEVFLIPETCGSTLVPTRASSWNRRGLQRRRLAPPA